MPGPSISSPDGAYTGTPPAGSPFPIAFLSGGRFAAAETDELDVTRLVVYEMPPDGHSSGRRNGT